MSRLAIVVYWLQTTVFYTASLIRFVPKSHREAYRQSSRINILASILYQSIWAAALVSSTDFRAHHFIVGTVIWMIGCWLVVWARRVNPYFVSILVKPEKYITTGPYRYLPHPGYIGYVGMAVGAFVAIGSLLSALFCLLYVLLIIDRMQKEGELLGV